MMPAHPQDPKVAFSQKPVDMKALKTEERQEKPSARKSAALASAVQESVV